MGIKYKSPTPSAAMIVPSDDISTGVPAISPIPADRVQEAVSFADPKSKPPRAKVSKTTTAMDAPGALVGIVGTFSEIQALGFSINGVKLDLAMLSVLTRLGMGKKIGEAPKPPGARGKAAGIWELPLSVCFTLTKE